MEQTCHTREQRTSSVRARVVPATSVEVASLFPALLGLLLALLLL